MSRPTTTTSALTRRLTQLLGDQESSSDLSADPQVEREVLRFLDTCYGPTLADRLPIPGQQPSEVSLSWPRRGEVGCAGPGERPTFLHPDLQPALTAALDRHVRDALDLEAGEAELVRLRAVRDLGQRVIELITTAESRRLAAWLEPRRVSASSWCVCLDQIPRALWAEVLANDTQRAEWRELFGVELGCDSIDRLDEHPTLVVDTALFDPALTDRVRDALDDPQGILIEGDNAHALRLLAPRFAGQVQCAYLDPPFNTENASLAYADRLPRAAWLCFIEERVALVRELLRPDGTLYAHIDQHEKERLRLLLDDHLHYVAEIIWRIGWLSGFKTRARKFIRNHDTIYQYGRGPKPLFNKRYLPYPEGYVRRDGKPPTGKGIPLEDTWNCSSADRLDSIQIMSFSREKVGCGNLTQKNENLLERMLLASSNPGDWVLDPFAGSGTTCATAHKLGRRWIGIERSATARDWALPRLKKVLFGDRYGISRAHDWTGGGAFEVRRLEPPGA